MEKMFVHIAKKATFTTELQSKYENSIVFIKDTQEIYTHGTFYAIPEEYRTKITSLESAVAALQAAKAFSKISDGTNVAESPSAAGTITFNKGSNVDIKVGADGVTISATDTKYTSGTGISVTGTTINHSNSVAAGTAQGDASKTLAFGGTFTIPTITYDAQGHITAKGTTTMTMPAAPTFSNWRAKNIVGASATAVANAATTNATTFLNLIENGEVRSSHQITGAGKVSVAADATGKITITGANASVASGATNGTISVDGQEVAVEGLGSAAYTEFSAYATAAQGTKADNAVPKTTTVNGHALSANVTITKADVGLGNVDNESKATMFTSPAFTGTPTAPTAGVGTNTQQIATTAFVQAEIEDKISVSQALRFKGTVGTGGDVTALPTSAEVGDVYIVKTAGNYAGEGCEPGDMIVCTKAASPLEWSVIQRNLDGAVTGKSLTANQVILGDGSSQVKALAAGSNGQILKIVGGVPTWAAETIFTPNAATDTELGGIKTGFTNTGKKYAVDLDADDKAFVEVAWEDTKYTFASGTTGNFTVTPSSGTAQTISIGKPATAGTADNATNATHAAAAAKVDNALSVQLNGGAATVFDGSAAKSVNITPTAIGAAAATHNQASNTINAMTGYTKATSVSAIAASDSLNSAIGKLEAMWDWEEL